MGIYNRKILRQKERKHAFDQQKSKILEKKKGNTLSTRKKARLKKKRRKTKEKQDIDQEKNKVLRSHLFFLL